MKRSLRSWLWRVPLDQEIDEELALHVEMRTRELIDSGMDPRAARAAALDRLGDLSRLKRTMSAAGRKRDREMRLTLWIEELRDDVKVAFRQLKNSPAFTLVAVLTLALGIGANSAIFALVDATLLRPLPYGNPSALVTIVETSDTVPRSFVSPLNMQDWIARSRSFENIAGFTPSVGSMVMAGADGNAETVPRQWVTQGILDVLEVKMVAGRRFTAEDEAKRANVFVMSEAFWRSRFNADPSIVGKEMRLDGMLFTLVGIVPKDFQLQARSTLWAVRPFVNLPPRARSAYILSVAGRLKPGVAIEAAREDLSAVAAGLAEEFPQFNRGRGVALEPLHDTLVGSDLKLTSMLFLGVVGFVLLICCANVANLLLARATVRSRELAVRSALGAGRRRIIRQLLTESVVLSLLGGACGVAIGAVILGAAPSVIPENLLPPTVTLAFDLRVVGFAAAAALIVGIVFGITPAWQATSFSSAEVMRSDSRTTTGGGGRLRGLLVMAEVATAVLLFFGAGLLLRTLIAVESYDRGYRAGSILSMLVDPLGSKYPTPQSLQQFFDQVEGEIRSVPGVKDMAWTSALPLGDSLFGDEGVSYAIVGDPPVDDSKRPRTEYQVVNATYFSTLDLPIVEGRAFDARDNRDGVRVCIINEAMARDFRGRSPIGMRIELRSQSQSSAGDKPDIREIVGVARQVKHRPDEKAEFVQVYAPLAQDLVDDIYLLVRPGTGRADALTPSIRAAISRVDKEQLVSIAEVMTLEDVAAGATGRHRFRAVMVITFAVLALVLAMVGVFGILAYSVQQHVRDFAVRRALGASSGDVLRLVVSTAVRVIAAGAVIGLVLSAGLGRLLSTMLFGVEPLDPLTFAAVTVVIALTAALSAAGPAWRAARIDPAAALRAQ